MKATEANLLIFLKKSPQFIIPIYQRNYSWTAEQCRQLWADLLRAGRSDKINAHFIGSIVYIERALSTVTNQESLLVIDGQQRLTTSTLLICALANHFETQGVGEVLQAFSAKKLRNYYLVNPDEEGERHFTGKVMADDLVGLPWVVGGRVLADAHAQAGDDSGCGLRQLGRVAAIHDPGRQVPQQRYHPFAGELGDELAQPRPDAGQVRHLGEEWKKDVRAQGSVRYGLKLKAIISYGLARCSPIAIEAIVGLDKRVIRRMSAKLGDWT